MNSLISKPLQLASLVFLVGTSRASYGVHEDMFFDNQIVPIVLSASKLPLI